MAVSLSELTSRVFFSLEAAKEFLDISDVLNAVVQKLNARTMQSRSSTANVLLSTTETFTVDNVLYDVTELIGKGVPCFVETRWTVQSDIEVWQNVRVVPLNQINEYRAMGALACAFYGEESDTQPTQYLRFTILPGGACRIRYDKDGTRTALDSDIQLPDELSELIVLDAQNSLISRIKLKLSMGLRRDAEGRTDAKMIWEALNDIRMQNVIDMIPLIKQWEIWAFGDRSKEDNFQKPTPRSGVLYAAGRNNNWQGWGNGGQT